MGVMARTSVPPHFSGYRKRQAWPIIRPRILEPAIGFERRKSVFFHAHSDADTGCGQRRTRGEETSRESGARRGRRLPGPSRDSHYVARFRRPAPEGRQSLARGVSPWIGVNSHEPFFRSPEGATVVSQGR
jgi:hypothetical protein